MTAINSILCMDCSGSMSGVPLSDAAADASYFVAIQSSTDQVGMVSFSSTVTNNFPLSPMTTTNKLTLMGDLSGLSAGGATDIQDAINNANTMLGSNSPSAIVLLTDGVANVGTVPPVAPSGCAPIYPIGLGYGVNTQDLQNLATSTGGTYYASPTRADLSQMYNDIVGQTNVAAVLTNTMGSSSRVVVMGTTTVSSGATSVKIGATWTNTSLQYTPGTPSGAQLTLLIHCPQGTSMPTAPTEAGDGYVLYEIPNPTAGTYTSYLYTPDSNSTHATIGAFDPTQTAKIHCEMPQAAKVGQPLSVKCYVADADGSAVERWSLSGLVDAPAVDLQTALNTHRAELDAIHIDTGDDSEEVTDNLRMLELERLRGPGHPPLIPRHPTPLLITHGTGENSFSFTPQTSGTHIVKIYGEGHAPVGGRGFNLVRVIPITVE